MEKLSSLVLLAINPGQMLTLHGLYFIEPFLTIPSTVRVSYRYISQGPLLEQLPHSQEQWHLTFSIYQSSVFLTYFPHSSELKAESVGIILKLFPLFMPGTPTCSILLLSNEVNATIVTVEIFNFFFYDSKYLDWLKQSSFVQKVNAGFLSTYGKALCHAQPLRSLVW